MSSNYPPGVTGFEPQIAGYAESEGTQELDCDCGHTMEVDTSEDYSHGTVTWIADWTCPKCNQSNSREGWYDPNDNN